MRTANTFVISYIESLYRIDIILFGFQDAMFECLLFCEKTLKMRILCWNTTEQVARWKLLWNFSNNNIPESNNSEEFLITQLSAFRRPTVLQRPNVHSAQLSFCAQMSARKCHSAPKSPLRPIVRAQVGFLPRLIWRKKFSPGAP